jgi:flagellar motor switch protein FliM
MTTLLSQEEIDALLTDVSGESGTHPQSEDSKRKIWMYDFKQPNLVHKDQIRILESLHDKLVKNLSVYLSEQLRMIVDLKLVTVDQVLYGDYVRSITSPGALYVGKLENPDSQFIFEISPQLVIFIVERLLGGKGSFLPNSRPISVVEKRIMNRLLQKLSSEIKSTWQPLKKINCSINRFEHDPEFVQIIPASEPAIIVSIETKVKGNSTLMNLCYPYQWITSLLSSLDIKDQFLMGEKEQTSTGSKTVAENLNQTSMLLQAVLGKVNISVNDFINLECDDVLTLDTRIHQDIPIIVNKKKLFSATVGQYQQRYSCQINSITTGAENE